MVMGNGYYKQTWNMAERQRKENRTAESERLAEAQERFLDRMEPYESLSCLADYELTCKDCDWAKQFHAAGTGKMLIHRHLQENPGHRTWLTYLGKKKVQV